jgi:hypothetical protein
MNDFYDEDEDMQMSEEHTARTEQRANSRLYGRAAIQRRIATQLHETESPD